jgi:hypothetical protein
MTAELDVLRDAAARLERTGIQYMLTGSIALSYYAQPRMTRAIDLVAELSGRDVQALLASGADRTSASIPEDLGSAERRFRLCERFYGDLAARAFPHR